MADTKLLRYASLLLTAEVVHAPSYSRGKWRVRVDGQDLLEWREHPMEGIPPFTTPICADTKRDAEAALRRLRHTTSARLLAAVIKEPA